MIAISTPHTSTPSNAPRQPDVDKPAADEEALNAFLGQMVSASAPPCMSSPWIRRRVTAVLAALAIMFVVPSSAAWAGKPGHSMPVVSVLNSTALGGLGSGSTIGPDGALYVTNGNAGTLVRIDPRNGSATVVGTGLPPRVIFVGGAMDVAFVGHRAYVLVTAAGSDFGVPDAVMGIYRLKRDGTFSAFADLGTWSAAHPPADPDWNAAQGLQYSLDVWRDGFVVADAHLGRVIRVDSRGHISELLAFPSTNSVPTGLEVANGKVFVATAGPIPHLPSDSAISAVRRDGSTKVVGKWAADYAGDRGLIVDVEMGRHQRLYGLLQGHWDHESNPENEGAPAAANTGEIVAVNEDGSFESVVSGLDQPTSLELVGGTAFVVTLSGTILRIDRF
ncbi:MAG TPA: ScyD/ScyE family protein [Microlunatus sp.]|nr:ScyD/ScyE family protein [Microlunatus sp.]